MKVEKHINLSRHLAKCWTQIQIRHLSPVLVQSCCVLLHLCGPHAIPSVNTGAGHGVGVPPQSRDARHSLKETKGHNEEGFEPISPLAKRMHFPLPGYVLLSKRNRDHQRPLRIAFNIRTPTWLKNMTEIKACCTTLFIIFMVLQDFCGICFSFHFCKLAKSLKQFFNWEGKRKNNFPSKNSTMFSILL